MCVSCFALIVFPGVLRGLPGPRLATTPTNRPRRSLSSPGVYVPGSLYRPGVCGSHKHCHRTNFGNSKLRRAELKASVRTPRPGQNDGDIVVSRPAPRREEARKSSRNATTWCQNQSGWNRARMMARSAPAAPASRPNGLGDRAAVAPQAPRCLGRSPDRGAGAKLKAVILLLPKFKLLATAGRCSSRSPPTASCSGWTFAVGFVVLILVHEMGHVIQLRREGIKASAPMFIPFLGAVISARSLGENATAEARVGLAGPILGSIGAAACIADLAADRQRHLAGAGVHRLLPEPVQPAAGRAARRRPGDGGDGAVDVVRRVRGDDPAGDHLPQPDHPADRADRRLRDVQALEAAQRRRAAQQRAYYRVARATGRWSRPCTWA